MAYYNNRRMPFRDKTVIWVGSSKRDLCALSEDVQDIFGYAIDLAQRGKMHPDAKLMKGDLHGVTEVVANERTDTYRAMYTVQFKEFVYVLHVFQKKSKIGKATPRSDLDLIEQRYKASKRSHEETQKRINAAKKR